MNFSAFHLTGFGRLVACEQHATDVWMWLWMDQDMGGQVVDARGNDRACALCTPQARCPEALDEALARQGRPVLRAQAFKRAA